MEMESVILEYYDKNGRRLRKIVNNILARFGGISQKDYDDFYSLANEVFVEAMRKYDDSCKFDTYLFSCLTNQIKTEMTRRNRRKRRPDNGIWSIEQMEEEGKCPEDLGRTDFYVEWICDTYAQEASDGRVEVYMRGLSQLQRQIVERRVDGMTKQEILQELGISEYTYNRNLSQLKSYDRAKTLFNREDRDCTKEARMVGVQTAEISKCTNYSVSSYIKKLKNYSIRGDHPLQRNSGQWSSVQKYNLITTVLNRYPIPEVILAEQIRDNGTENWLIDGKQRLTNLLEYEEGAFKIGKAAERPLIHYQTVRRDEAGAVVLDADGTPEYEQCTVDVRGKYFHDLPEALKERFNDYTITAVQYLNCSDDDIEYHIRRYNAAKPMSPAQKGVTHLGERYARMVKRIACHPFFERCAPFKLSEFSNGTIDRVITESIMVIWFLNDWKKKQEDICEFLKVNAQPKHFEEFERMIGRLSTVITKEGAELFHSKDAFLWFGLFHRFDKSEADDCCFVEFLASFKDELHKKVVDGQSYDSLCQKGTKDKAAVFHKLMTMEKLMEEFLENK